MNDINIENNNIIRIFKGVISAFIITLISIFIFAVLLTYTDISERVIPIVIIALTFISILIGTIIEIRKITRNGMLNGGIIGGIYVTLLYIISSIVNTGFTFNIYTILMIIGGTIAGIIGGIIGVNT